MKKGRYRVVYHTLLQRFCLVPSSFERAGQVRIVFSRAVSARVEEDNGSNLPDTSTSLSVFLAILASVLFGCCILSTTLKSFGVANQESVHLPRLTFFYSRLLLYFCVAV